MTSNLEEPSPDLTLSLNETNGHNKKKPGDKSWIFLDKRPYSIKDEILSLRYQNEWCDTVIKVDETITYAHKAILSAGCQMFKGMFRSIFLENIRNEIDLSHMFSDVNMANVFIDYLYTGRVLLSDKNIEAILETAHMTLMVNLQNHCLQFLLHRLSVANVISTMRLAERYEANKLIEVCDSLLQRSEDLLVFSSEIAKMKSRNFFAFLKTEPISNYRKSVRSSLVLCWLSVNIRKRGIRVKNWFHKNPVDEDVVGNLPLSSIKKSELLTWLGEQIFANKMPACLTDETPADQLLLIGNWTVVVQSLCGKTGFYCPEMKRWHVLNLPVIDGELLGLLNGDYLAYFESEFNVITYLHLPTDTIKRTSIPGSYPHSYYQNCDVGSARPYHYFCRHGFLYGINPISTGQNIVGWGVYRYFLSEVPGWQLLGDTIFTRDFNRDAIPRSEVMMYPVYDSTGYSPDEPVVYIFLQEYFSSSNVSVTFLYNHQIKEYYSFTACKTWNQCLDILVFPEVVFVARFNSVMGLSDLPSELNFTEEEDTSQVNLCYQVGNSSLKSLNSLSLTIPKPSHFPLRYAWAVSVVSAISGKRTTPLCPFTNSKQVVLFDGNLYLAAHLTPLDYQVMIYDLNNYLKCNLLPLPFPSNQEIKMTPVRTTRPISSLIEACKNKNVKRRYSKRNYRERIFIDWVFNSWQGRYKIVNEPDSIATQTSDNQDQ